jgi:fatty-acyl-CoA synthase
LAAPHPQERSHRLRLACGNGLQGDVWRQFQGRFAIPQILEFYAATEGNLSLYNCEGKPGAIGRIPPFLARQSSAAIIQCDPETGVPLRNADGFCVPCADDEAGEAISQIKGRQFDGYTDPVASQKKILHDVFTKGDRWFRSNDLMRKDVGNYFFFVDRLGDTFRWKGENVSTTEVAAVLRGCAGVLDVVVYGVAVPGNEGRAGMAAMSTCQPFSFTALSAHLRKHLPDYAHPVFVRLCAAMDVTGTFKLTKTDLAGQGFMTAADPVWRRDSKTGEFQRHLSAS